MPSKSHTACVGKATVYLDEDLHRALRLKSAETRESMSELVNDALRLLLAEAPGPLGPGRRRPAPTVSSRPSRGCVRGTFAHLHTIPGRPWDSWVQSMKGLKMWKRVGFAKVPGDLVILVDKHRRSD